MTKFALVAGIVSLTALFVSGCGSVTNALGQIDELDAIQRSWVAEDAQTQMVGMTREEALACMGPPNSKANEGDTELFREVWRYISSDNAIVGTSTGGGFAPQVDDTTGSSAPQQYCTVNVVMAGERVSQIYYQGPPSGYASPREQCFYAVAQCVQ